MVYLTVKWHARQCVGIEAFLWWPVPGISWEILRNFLLISRKISHFLIISSYLFLLYFPGISLVFPISRLFLNYFFFVSRILLTSQSFLTEFFTILWLFLVNFPISQMSSWVKWEFVIYSYRVTGPVACTSCSQCMTSELRFHSIHYANSTQLLNFDNHTGCQIVKLCVLF